MSNPHASHPHGPFNAFSPVSVPANMTPGPPNHQLAFHLPRQSISMSGPPNEWDLYPPIYTPPLQQPTPPAFGNPGVWSPPFGMRNGSPGMTGPIHGHSASQFNAGHPMDSPMDPYGAHHGLVGQERFYNQQIRRGSPLAHVRHPGEHEEEEISPIGPTIDAPVPKHRHQLSLTLQKEYENAEAYQQEHVQKHTTEDDEGFVTNPASPAPVAYPEHPEMPGVETDVHNGPELASNPDDDLSDEEVEKQKNRLEVADRTEDLARPYIPLTQYARPHSRSHSLSQRQHDYDTTDPVQNSAMSMLMAGEGIGAGHHRAGMIDELLSEDGRTNISDTVTNPSEPDRTFSQTTSHGQQLSNTSNAWVSDHTKNASSTNSSTSKPKFNVNAAEFKFEPSPSFSFTPKGNPFSQANQMASISSSDPTSPPPVTFGGFGVGYHTGNFRPSLVTSNVYTPLFEKGAAAFSPSAPTFTPSYAKPPAPPAANPIFGEIVKPPPVKKVIPIVRPSSRLHVHELDASASDTGDRRDAFPEGGRKRVKQSPRLSLGNDIEIPALEMIPSEAEKVTEGSEQLDEKISESSEEDEQLLKSPLHDILGDSATSFEPFEFRNKNEAQDFANAEPATEGRSRLEARISPLGEEGVLSPEEAFVAAAAATPKQLEQSNFAFKPDVPEFSFKPNAQEFNFEFHKPCSPPEKVFEGMSESRYAHTPSPPLNHPAPSPLGIHDTSLLPEEALPHPDVSEHKKTNASGGFIPRPMPTDAELDEVVRYMDHTNTTYMKPPSVDEGDENLVDGGSNEEATIPEEVPWKLPSSPRRPIPSFEPPTPQKRPQSHRSEAPSPSPRRADPSFGHQSTPSFSSSESSSESPSEPELPIHAIGGSYVPKQDIGIARDVDSDWDDMLSGEEHKLRPQSRLFFDAHVEELVGGLFQRKLDPMVKALNTINSSLNTVAALMPIKSVAEFVPSDADDEEDTQILPPKSPMDKKLEKIKVALFEVLESIQPEAAISEQSLQEVKDIIAASSRSSDFAQVRAVMTDLVAKAARQDDMAIVRASLEDVSLRMVQSTELGDLNASIVEAIQKTAQAEDMVAVRHSIGELMSGVAQRVDLVDVKLALQDVSMKAAQRNDLADIKAAFANTISHVASKEDLVPLHNVLAEAFAKTAKTEEELNGALAGIMDSLLGVEKGTHQELLRLKHENDQFRNMLGEVLRLTRDNAENMDFHQEHVAETVKEGQAALTSRVSEVYSAIREVTKFVQSRASKSDVRRNLVQQEHKEDAVAIRNTAETTKQIQEELRELTRSQPTLDNFRSVVAGMQPRLDEFKSAFHEAATGSLPGLEDIKMAVEQVVAGTSGIEGFKRVMEEDRLQKLEELKAVIGEVAKSQPSLQELRVLMEDVISKQQLFVPLNIDNKEEDGESKRSLRRRIESLERNSAHFEKRGEAEAQSKRQWEEKAIELEAKLRIAEEEASKKQEVAEEKDRQLKTFDEKRHQTLTSAQMRSALLEGALPSLQKSNGELSAKNAELLGYLRNAQESEEKHRAWNSKLEEENRERKRALETMKSEMEESIKVRESFRTKFDRVQEDMRRVSLEIGQEQGKWRKTHEEQKARIEVLEARLSAEFTKSQGLEGEVKRLEVEEKEAIRTRVEFDQLKRVNSKSEELIAQLRHEAVENQSRMAQLTHEVDQSRKAVHQEANAKHAALQLAEQEKERLSKDVTESKLAALKEQQLHYEAQIDHLRAKHERASRLATEDSERDNYFLQERLNIAHTESKHLREHIESLQSQVKSLSENFKVANVAAQAAAQAATSVREMSAPHVSDERALRESVDVLQSQLQEREARIDHLESELADIDKVRIKETEARLQMYRDLLDLRTDDLEEIIHTCNLPELDRGSLRDAATRLKASLEMQLHEKERAMGIVKPEDKNSASQIAAKLPGVATAAWQSFKNRGRVPSELSPKDSPTLTPSRPSSAASSFFNGILTPPNTQRLGARFGRGGVTADAPSSAPHSAMSARQREKQPIPAIARRPAPGPQLFRRDNYDADADSSVLSGEFYDETDDDATETGEDHGNMEPFGASPYSRVH
jgi:hypothetical protein